MRELIQKLVITLFCCLLVTVPLFAQDNLTDSIKVYGNCNMCKANIEGALKKKDGVLEKSWNKETKILAVSYNPSKTTIQQIGQKVADAGYDNQYATASNAAYFNLHSCCQYERPQQSTEEKKTN